ncbi:hypothetical protein COO60DRAFT_66156 [Scenedesmus sp. NREL 46B-D3]|nr:hypothetical protein COO60DRAFT_66156 [Scenedesmus sp. NREL 46B-D3]
MPHIAFFASLLGKLHCLLSKQVTSRGRLKDLDQGCSEALLFPSHLFSEASCILCCSAEPNNGSVQCMTFVGSTLSLPATLTNCSAIHPLGRSISSAYIIQISQRRARWKARDYPVGCARRYRDQPASG